MTTEMHSPGPPSRKGVVSPLPTVPLQHPHQRQRAIIRGYALPRMAPPPVTDGGCCWRKCSTILAPSESPAGPPSAAESSWGEPRLAQPDFSLCPILLLPLSSKQFSSHRPSWINTPTLPLSLSLLPREANLKHYLIIVFLENY